MINYTKMLAYSAIILDWPFNDSKDCTHSLCLYHDENKFKLMFYLKKINGKVQILLEQRHLITTFSLSLPNGSI